MNDPRAQNFEADMVEKVLDPSVQSGDSVLSFALGLDQRCMDSKLADRGSFLCTLGVSYGAVPSAISRTYLVSPTEVFPCSLS